MAAFFKKLKDKIRKEYPDVVELFDSAKNGNIKQKLQDTVADITGLGTHSRDIEYTNQCIEEDKPQRKANEDRKEMLRTIYRDPDDIRLADETRREINYHIKSSLKVRRFVWGSSEPLASTEDFIVDHCWGEEDRIMICKYLEEKGLRYDREKMGIELDNVVKQNFFHLYHRANIDEYIFLDRLTKDEILQLIEDDIELQNEIKSRTS